MLPSSQSSADGHAHELNGHGKAQTEVSALGTVLTPLL